MEEFEKPVVNGEDTAASAEETLQTAGENAAAEIAAAEEAPVLPTMDAASPRVLDWQYGALSPKPALIPAVSNKKTYLRFGMAFGAVTLVCFFLLMATLFLGNSGFKIVREVKTERVVYVREYDSASGLLTPNEAADKIAKSTVTVSVRTETAVGHGSGFVYSADGYICTNYHVIEGAVAVQVILPTGYAYDAEIVGYNADADLAVLKITAPELVPVTLGSSADLLVGDDVVAVGTPAILDFSGTATFGKISATRRVLSFTDESGSIVKKMVLLQTDASVNPGNSGGPLADMYGNVIGVVVMKVMYYGDSVYDGVGFAIPMDAAKVVIESIIEGRSLSAGDNPVLESRTLLGIQARGVVGGLWYQGLDDDGAVTYSETEKAGYTYMPYDGVYVMNTNGANAFGRLYRGDVITKVNGLRVYRVENVIAEVNRYPAYSTARLTVMRTTFGVAREITVDIVLYEAS